MNAWVEKVKGVYVRLFYEDGVLRIESDCPEYKHHVFIPHHVVRQLVLDECIRLDRLAEKDGGK